MLTAFVAALISSGAFTRPIDFESVRESLTAMGLRELIAVGVAVTVLSLTMNVFQTPMVKVLEGYWRPTGPSLLMLQRGLRRHDAIRHSLNVDKSGQWTPSRWQEFWLRRVEHDRRGDFEQRYRDFCDALSRQYPPPADDDDADRLMPTRLGNALRAAEDHAGDRFGLDAVNYAGHLLATADSELVAYYEDARSELDVAVRFVFTWLACTLIAIVALFDDGPWMAVPLCTYLLAWLNYRAAVRSATTFGEVLGMLVDLHRFDLLRRLHRPLPDTLDEERVLIPRYLDALGMEPDDDSLHLPYEHPSDAVSHRADSERRAV